jgi:hypothetical protein
MELTGSSVQFEASANASITYQVTCSGVCTAAASGVVDVAALALGNTELDTNSPFVFAQSANQIQLTCFSDAAATVNARVFDTHGRLIHTRSFVASSGHMETFDTANWSKGVYTLSIEQHGTHAFSRVFSK